MAVHEARQRRAALTILRSLAVSTCTQNKEPPRKRPTSAALNLLAVMTLQQIGTAAFEPAAPLNGLTFTTETYTGFKTAIDPFLLRLSNGDVRMY